MYTLIENFCLGIRRLELFGRPSSLRRGWVTVMTWGVDRQLPLSEDGSLHVEGEEGGQATKWQQEIWEEKIKELLSNSKAVVPMTSEIDTLRPKSPVRHGQGVSSGGGSAVSGGVAVGIPSNANTNANNPNANRFTSGPRFTNQSPVLLAQNQMVAHNQMMIQPGMMGIGVSVNPLGMGIGFPVSMDDVMSPGWNSMINMGSNVNTMNNINLGATGPHGMSGGHAHSHVLNANMGMTPVGPMGGVNIGPPLSMQHPQMMGQMNGGFQGHAAMGFGGVPVFNPSMSHVGMGWGDQGEVSVILMKG